MAAIRHAPIAWAQREDTVLITVELEAIKVEELTITSTSFKFKGTTADATCETSFDFFADVNDSDIKKGQNTRHLHLCIGKKEPSWWPRLLKDKVKVHWLKVDFAKWKEEDDSDNEADAGGMNFNNFDLSQYTNQMGGMGGGEAPDLGDFDDEDGEDMPDLEDDDEEGEKKTNGDKH